MANPFEIGPSYYGDLGVEGIVARDKDHFEFLLKFMIRCQLCWRFFSSYGRRDQHFKKMHNSHVNSMTMIDLEEYYYRHRDEKTLFDCEICPIKDSVLVDGDDLEFHLRHGHRVSEEVLLEMHEYALAQDEAKAKALAAAREEMKKE
jgi:hypothetical protein